MMKQTPRDLVKEILGEGYYYSRKHNGYVFQESFTGMPLDEKTILTAMKNLECAMSTLEEREICLLRKRYFDGLTLREAGLKVVTYSLEKNPCDGLTKERARQIICRAIRKLKRPSRMQILLWGV